LSITSFTDGKLSLTILSATHDHLGTFKIDIDAWQLYYPEQKHIVSTSFQVAVS